VAKRTDDTDEVLDHTRALNARLTSLALDLERFTAELNAEIRVRNAAIVESKRKPNA
jgi:hypothetical protein